jgi:hypothetical protein
MTRTSFYYTIDNVNYLFAVKHCLRPKQTKIYKHLIKLLDKNKVESIGYKLGTINY